MKRSKKSALLTIAALFVFGQAVGAGAGVAKQEGDFSPKVKFELSDRKIKANPELTVSVEQDAGEEELADVRLTVPPGFKLPADAKIPNNDQLGSGQIFIAAGPGCNPNSPSDEPKAAIFAPATLREADRTQDQIDRGVYAVWVLDISGVTRVTLEVTGSTRAGFQLFGPIPQNDNTCPPFSFDMTVNSESASGVPILVNPKKPGKKTFLATFNSQDSPKIATIRQIIKITK